MWFVFIQITIAIQLQSDMEVCYPYTERYLLKLTFYAADCPVLSQSGKYLLTLYSVNDTNNIS